MKDYFNRKITLFRWQLNLLTMSLLLGGIIVGFYGAYGIIPKVFAASTPWTQTDWSGGQNSSLATGTVTTYSAASNTDPTTTTGNVTLSTNSGWYNSSWTQRRKLTIDNTTSNLGTTSEALTDFPVLVVLTSSNIDYSKTLDSGQDLRFTDSDGSTPIPYEIEKWDESGTSYVWVKVPQIDSNSSSDYIYMYYGNSAASDGQNINGTWDDNYVGVWHLGEISGTTTSDSSGSNTGTKVSSTDPQPTNGQIDGAQDFSSDYVSVNDSASLDMTSAITMSGWVTADSLTQWGSIFMKSTSGNWDDGYGIYYSANLCAFITNYNTYKACTSFPTTLNSRYVVATYNGSNLVLYIDGAQVTSSSTSVAIATNNASLQLGKGAGGNYYWDGKIDEFRLSNVARSAAYVAASYHSETNDYLSFGSQEGVYQSSGTLTSNIFDSEQLSAWGNLTYTGTGSITVKVRSSNSSTMSGADDWSTCSTISSGTDLSSTDCISDGERYIQYQLGLTTADVSTTPIFQDITIAFSPYDTTNPTTNASAILMYTASGGRSVASSGWNNATTPYFSWTSGADNGGGSGLKGYCLYLGTDSAGDPATSKGMLGTSPVSTSGSTCQFIISSTSIDLATSGYLGSALASGTTYYLNVKAIDNGNNIFSGSATTFYFQHDGTAPTNVAYLTMPSQNFSNVADMNFSWPTSGGSAAADSDSGTLGWQYQINGTSGAWQGTTHSSTLDLDYIPATASGYTLVNGRDAAAIVSGNNVVYFRTVDTAGNISGSSTYRTGNLIYGGAAPAFGGGDNVTVTPNTSSENSFSLSWPEASASGSNSVEAYYYMINTSPPATLATMQGNSSTYINNGTETSVEADALPNVNKGTNTVYVVAVDDASTPNYSPSNYISGTFTLNSTDPDNVNNLVASDSSIKASEQWNVTLTWTAPEYQGAGNLTYIIMRSTDNVTFSQVGTTTGLSYVDNTPASTAYYYKVVTEDGADAQSSGTNVVTITPTGKWTSPPGLNAGPTVAGITTKKATITWGTDRTASSIISYGTKSGSYNDVDASNTDQVTSHTLVLTNLTAGTTYYYKAKWTDEDGNTGISDEKSFTTTAAPAISGVKASDISLTSAYITFTISDGSKATIQYGKSTAYGGSVSTTTSTSKTTYSVKLADLDDGTSYHYRIVMEDPDGNQYLSDNYTDLITLPRPKISSVRIQQVVGTAQPTILVSWLTNTEVSSIVTYYPEGNAAAARDEVNVALVKGEHKLIVRGLNAQAVYNLVVKGRDKAGNEATSDSQKVTTATDTRPPAISDLHAEGTSGTQNANGDQQSQMTISWNTDEPASSQVEFGEGTGTSYPQKSAEDTALTYNHLVVISGLTPSKVYHMRALAKDKAGNLGNSIDTVTITPKSTDNALNLVILNLQQAFGLLGRL